MFPIAFHAYFPWNEFLSVYVAHKKSGGFVLTSAEDRNNESAWLPITPHHHCENHPGVFLDSALQHLGSSRCALWLERNAGRS